MPAPGRTSGSASHTSATSKASKLFVHGPELADGTILPLLPFLMEDAEVTGEVRGVDTAAGWAGAARTLLHGKRRPAKYSRCNVCTMISCNKNTNLCSGHCKRKGKLFTCRRKGVTAAASPCTDDRPEVSNLPADTLSPLRSVAVAATAPFIGCANITGLPSGCPAEGTRGVSDDGQRFTVLGSSCEQYRYSLQQCEREGPTVTPFYPFGYCKCVTKSNVGLLDLGACRLSELRYKAPRAADTGGVPVRVVPEGKITMTTYGESEELDLGRYRYDMVFNFLGATVDVEMVVRDAILNEADDVTLDGPVAQPR